MNERVIINTDGACSGNPSPGGFAAVIDWGKHRVTVSGGDPKTTNNRMELAAVIEALKLVNDFGETSRLPVTVRLDSKYVTEPFNQGWLRNWKSRNWRKADGKLVLSPDLWQELDQLVSGRDILWVWVKGHSGDPMNEFCDRIAVEQASIAPREGRYWVSAGNPKSVAVPLPTEFREAISPVLAEQLGVQLELALLSLQSENYERTGELIRRAMESALLLEQRLG